MGKGGKTWKRKKDPVQRKKGNQNTRRSGGGGKNKT